MLPPPTSSTNNNSTLLLSPSSSSSFSSSSSGSSSSSSSDSSSSNNKKKKTKKTMEDVWKDISISSLPGTPIHHHIHHHPTSNSHLKGMILQDFLNTQGDRRTRSMRSSIDSSSSSSQLIPPQIKPLATELQFFDNQMMNYESQPFQLQENSSVPNLIAGDAAFDGVGVVGLRFLARRKCRFRLREGRSSDGINREQGGGIGAGAINEEVRMKVEER